MVVLGQAKALQVAVSKAEWLLLPVRTSAPDLVGGGHEVQGQTFGNYSDGLALEGLKEAISHVEWDTHQVVS